MDTEDGMNMDVEARAQLQSIIDALSPAVRLEMTKLPREHVTLMHHGIGTLIRNRHRHGELKELFLWSRSRTDVEARSLMICRGLFLSHYGQPFVPPQRKRPKCLVARRS